MKAESCKPEQKIVATCADICGMTVTAWWFGAGPDPTNCKKLIPHAKLDSGRYFDPLNNANDERLVLEAIRKWDPNGPADFDYHLIQILKARGWNNNRTVGLLWQMWTTLGEVGDIARAAAAAYESVRDKSEVG